MNDNDMSNMIKKAQEMINNNQIPDELKSIVANMKNNSNSSSSSTNNSINNETNKYTNPTNIKNNNTSTHSNMGTNRNSNSTGSGPNTNANFINGEPSGNINSTTNNANSSENTNGFDIDINTMMKIQNIMSKMKSTNSEDDMSKLLLSLKPYLRDGKKEKVDEYVKLIKMGKLTKLFEEFGGGNS